YIFVFALSLCLSSPTPFPYTTLFRSKPTYKLGCHVENGVPELYLAEAEKRERHCWIEMCPRLLAPRRVHNADCGQPHCNPCERKIGRAHVGKECRSRW